MPGGLKEKKRQNFSGNLVIELVTYFKLNKKKEDINTKLNINLINIK